MQTNIKQLRGNWDIGFALDKHIISSEYLGDDEFGHARFHTTRTEAGEATYQLKYKRDWSQVSLLATAVAESIYPLFPCVDLIVPIPASNWRPRQPVTEVCKALGGLVNC